MNAELWVAIVSAVVGAAGVAVAIWTVRAQRRPKQLDYRIVSSAGLLRPDAQRMREPLKIDYDGVPMRAPWLTTVRIMNTGKRAVVAADYVEPIRVVYERNAAFDGYVTSSSRDGLWPEGQSIWPTASEAPPNSVEPVGRHAIQPPLLNPGEWLEVQLLSDGNPGELRVEAVFPDQARPMRVAVPALGGRRRQPILWSLAATNIVALGGIAHSIYSRSGDLPKGEAILLVTVLGGISIAYMVLSILRDRRRRRSYAA